MYIVTWFYQATNEAPVLCVEGLSSIIEGLQDRMSSSQNRKSFIMNLLVTGGKVQEFQFLSLLTHWIVLTHLGPFHKTCYQQVAMAVVGC